MVRLLSLVSKLYPNSPHHPGAARRSGRAQSAVAQGKLSKKFCSKSAASNPLKLSARHCVNSFQPEVYSVSRAPRYGATLTRKFGEIVGDIDPSDPSRRPPGQTLIPARPAGGSGGRRL